MEVQDVVKVVDQKGSGAANAETAMILNGGANPFAAAAMQAKNSVMAMYKTVGINAFKSDGTTVRAVTMEARGLSATAENPYIMFNISNKAEGATNQTLYFGSVLGIALAYQRHNTSSSGCDATGLTDDYGAKVLKVQGFSELVNYSPVIVTQIQVSCTETNQVSQQWKYGDLPYDDNVQSINIAVNPQFTRFDQNGTIVNIPGVWFLGPQTFLSTIIIAQTAPLITLYLSGSASGRNFRQMNG